MEEQSAPIQCKERPPLFSAAALRRLIIPLVIEQFLAMTIGMADTIMVTSVGEHAVSGVSLVDNISILLINIFSALATGGAVVAAQYLGSRDESNACAAAKQLFYVVGALSTATMAVCLLFREPILRLVFGQLDASVMEAAMTYFLLTALSYPLLAVYNAGAALFRSMGNSKVSMLASLLMNLINIGLNAVLIYGAGIGVAGAGFGTLFSRLAGAVLMTWLICRKGHVIHIDHLFRPEFRKQLVKKILRIGVPNGLENSFFQLGRVLLVSLISTFGTAQTAANAVANNIDNFGVIPGQALGLALITVVGQCVGAGDWDQVRSYTKRLVKLTYLCTWGLNAALLLGLPLILRLYSLTPETQWYAAVLIFIHNGCAMLFWPLAFTMPNALRAAGDVRVPMVISITSMLVVRVGGSYLLGLHFGLGAIGVWLAMVGDWVVRLICFVLRARKKLWLEHR